VVCYLRESGAKLNEITPRWEDITFVFNTVMAMVRQVLVLANANFKSFKLKLGF